MERITKSGYKFNLLNVLQGLNRYADVDEILNRLAAYEDTGLEPEEINKAVSIQHWEDAFKEQYERDLAELQKYLALGDYDHLLEIVEAEKDGRLVVLPCKVGDKVYRIEYIKDGDDYKIGVCEHSFGLLFYVMEKHNFGKTVFLTHEEAEAALKKMKGGEENG